MTAAQRFVATLPAAWQTSTVTALARVALRRTAARPILADAIQDAAGDENAVTAYLRGEIRPLTEGDAMTVLAAERLDPDGVAEQLSRANGRRRTRTLDLCDVAQAVGRVVATGQPQAIGGGTVANAYGYASSQTVCVVARGRRGRIRVGISEQSASKGASLYTPFGLRANDKPEAFQSWADQE